VPDGGGGFLQVAVSGAPTRKPSHRRIPAWVLQIQPKDLSVQMCLLKLMQHHSLGQNYEQGVRYSVVLWQLHNTICILRLWGLRAIRISETNAFYQNILRVHETNQG